MNAIMSWSDALSVGDAEIDEQHKALIGILIELYESIMKGNSENLVDRVLNDLVSYTRYHFRNEENYFALFGYPDQEAHKLAHAELEKRLEQYISKHKNSNADIKHELLDFLCEWIISHIMDVDSRYKNFFHDVVRNRE